MNQAAPGYQRVYQADALKGLAILSVLALHSLGSETLRAGYAWFYVWQAVPVLCVLLGYTGMRSRVSPFNDYLARRAWRLAPAFAITWLISLTIAIAKGALTISPLMLLGVLPASGPGNYFITLLFQFVLLLPVLRWLFDKSARLGLAASLAASLTFELVSFAIGLDTYLYSASIFRYLFAIGLGMWIATGRSTIPLAVPSLAYLYGYAAGFEIPFFIPLWQPQNLVGFGYAAALVELGIRYLPRRSTALGTLGKASYHIFLIQMLWFGQVKTYLPLYRYSLLAVSLVVCPLAGLLFWRVEGHVSDALRRRRSQGEHIAT